MKTTLKSLCLSAALMLAYTGVMSQAIPTIEMPLNQTIFANSNQGTGVSSNPVIVEFKNDANNSNSFSAYSSTCTISFRNQQFTGLSYGTASYDNSGNSSLQTTGLVFGAAPTLASDPTPQGALPVNRYDLLGAYTTGGGPTNNMYTSNPTAAGANLGTGIKVGNASSATTNGAVEVFTTAQALFGNASYPVGSRVYFGDIVITFSEPVKNPVIHLAGLGGSYRYTPFGVDASIAANYIKTFFSTELELVNTGLTSTLLSSNPLMNLSGNNILNANNANPNGGSVDVGIPSGELFNDYGAASGSVRINGNVQTLTYKVYLKSGTASQFAWSTKGLAADGVTQLITNALRDPFTGDVWRIGASYDKPVQQVSGNVFYDINGYSGNINTASINPAISTYEKVNINNTMKANLIDASGNVVATTPIGSDGTYLFDAVAIGNYTMQLTQVAGVPGQPKPATTIPVDWVYTGERNSLQAGNDASRNGIAGDGNSEVFTVTSGNNFPEVNFGVLLRSQLPLPVSLTSFNGSLSAGVAKLNWVVTGEVNMKSYSLERSIDGITYSNVTDVTPRNTNLLESYGYNDNVTTIAANKIYYRLKINDNNGSSRYSNVIILKKSSLKISSVYPNPFIESIKVELESATKDNAQIRIIDVLGKVIITQQEKIEIGGNQITINGLSRLTQGAYMIEITTSTEKILQKLTK
jgi:Secretion system C-terminal sorting domain